MEQVLATLKSSVGAFLKWWLTALAGMIPARISGMFRGGTGAAVIDLSGPDIVVSQRSGRTAHEIGRMTPRPDDRAGETAEVSRLVREATQSGYDIRLRLPADEALRKSIGLPIAAEEDLRQVLAFEMDRQTPFTAEQVYFDFSIRGRDAEAGRMDVELVAVPRRVVDQAVARAAAWGATPNIVDIGGGDSDDDWSLNLLPERELQRNGRGDRLTAALAVIAALLLLAVVYVPLEQQSAALAYQRAALDKVKEDAEAAIRLRQDIERLFAESDFLAKHKRESVKAVFILEEMTRILPDDTWLQRFQINDHEVRISGFSPSASKLVGLIEKSAFFERARFRSPVTQDQRTGMERFNLTADIPGP